MMGAMAHEAMVEDTVWLTLGPTFARGSGRRNPTGVRVTAMTRTRPPSKACVQVTVRMPAAVFAQMAPEVTIEIPEEAVMIPEPEVVVVLDPGKGS
jgi:hypothetical protein